jgi:outer membrane protein assembly factor BamB
MSTLQAADGLLRLDLIEGSLTCLFRGKDGALLSTMKAGRWGPGTQKSFILDGLYYKGGNAIDAKTGERVGKTLDTPAGLAWCGIATYAPGMGAIGHSTLGYKSPCGVGAWVAGGMLLYSPTVCGCGAVQGAVGFASGGEVFKRIETAPEHPLVRGPAYADAQGVGGPEAGASDWPAYRGDVRHRGSTSVKVGAEAQVAWTAVPAKPFEYTTLYNQMVDKLDERPTAPTVVGGTVYSAGSDGVVRAVGLADGKERWAFSADGPVLTSPAYEAGRLFVPCADGWVYALEAGSGRLAWKRRLAPMERRIHVFDQLMSTWPVLSLAAQDGTVYAAAGMLLTDGSKAFALDAATGEIRWSRFFPPEIAGSHVPAQKRVFGHNGHTAIAGDYVWMGGFQTMPLTLERKTGELPALSKEADKYRRSLSFSHIYAMQGQDVIVMDDQSVLAGGSHLMENQQLREGKRNRIAYRFYRTDERGAPDMDHAAPAILKVARIAPACDEELVVFAAPPPTVRLRDGRVKDNYKTFMSTVGLNVWKKQAFCKEGGSMQLMPLIDKEKSKGQRIVYRRGKDLFRDFNYADALWQKPEMDVSAVALAGNAVLVAHATSFEEHGWSGKLADQREARIRYGGWELSAYSREDGKELWKIALPSEPLRNGLAVASDGTVIVAYRDGSLLAVR